MKTQFLYLALFGALLLTSSCTTYQKIHSSYDKSVDFSSYQTFAWAPDSIGNKNFENTVYDNDIVRNNVKNYINHSMSQRGFVINTEAPDLILQLVLLNERKERIVTYFPNYYSDYYFYNPFYFPYYYPYVRFYTWFGWVSPPPTWEYPITAHTKTYVKGTIIINMYDRQTNSLVWAGSAEGDIYDPSYIENDVHPAINKIMKKFPVKPTHHQDLYEEYKIRNRIARTAEPIRSTP